jgi:hypothetical protein
VIDDAGTATLAGNTGSEGNRTFITSRPRGGSFSPFQYMRPGYGASLDANRDGDLVAWWQTEGHNINFVHYPRKTWASLGNPNRLPPAREVLPRDSESPLMSIDQLGNVPAIWQSEEPEGKRIKATVFTRFDFAQGTQTIAAPTVSGEYSLLNDIATNRAGATVATYVEIPPTTVLPPPESSVWLLERPADQAPPALYVVPAARIRRASAAARNAGKARARCDEICRISAAVRVRGRGRAVTVTRRGWRRTRARQNVEFSLALSRRERRLARRLLRARPRSRLVAVFRAEDAAGNRRVVRRALGKVR